MVLILHGLSQPICRHVADGLRLCDTAGREYVRTKRLYGDGSTEVVTRELGPVHGRGSKSGARRRQADADEGLHRGSKRHHQQPARPTAPPSASIFGDHSDRGEGKAARSGQGSLGGRRIGKLEELEAASVRWFCLTRPCLPCVA